MGASNNSAVIVNRLLVSLAYLANLVWHSTLANIGNATGGARASDY